MDHLKLNLVVESITEKRELIFPLRRLICAGWVGRDKKALQAHIDELAEHGVPGPTRTPIYMNFSTYLATTSDAIEVVSDESSGEVESLFSKREITLTLGSAATTPIGDSRSSESPLQSRCAERRK